MNKLPKSAYKFLGFLMVGTFIVFSFSPSALAATGEGLQPTLTVSGNSQVKASPDMASISLAVVSMKTDLADAQKENNQNTLTLINGLKQLGISDQDINTTSFNVWPQYQYDDGKSNNLNNPQITGYRIQNEIEVTVKDIDKLGTILDAALKNGANNINYIRFDKANKVQNENEALTIAVKNAQSKAASMASALGMKLGGIINVNQSGFNTILPLNSMDFGAGTANEAKGFSAVPIQAGQIDIEASVVITYQLIP